MSRADFSPQRAEKMLKQSACESPSGQTFLVANGEIRLLIAEWLGVLEIEAYDSQIGSGSREHLVDD